MPLVNLCRYLCPEVGGFTATGDKVFEKLNNYANLYTLIAVPLKKVSLLEEIVVDTINTVMALRFMSL